MSGVSSSPFSMGLGDEGDGGIFSGCEMDMDDEEKFYDYENNRF